MDNISFGCIGAMLQKARLLHNISQKDFAGSIGVSERVVRKMEAGENVHLETFWKACVALGYGEDISVVLSRQKPTTIQQHQDMISGKFKARKKAGRAKGCMT